MANKSLQFFRLHLKALDDNDPEGTATLFRLAKEMLLERGYMKEGEVLVETSKEDEEKGNYYFFLAWYQGWDVGAFYTVKGGQDGS